MKPRVLTLILSILLASCNTKDAKPSGDKIDECEVTYIVLSKENTRYCDYLSEEIRENVSQGSGDIKRYDSLTVGYVKYLDSISDAISKSSSSIFFEGAGYSNAGKEFIKQTKEYKTAIEELAGDNLKKRLNLVLNTNDVGIVDNGVAENNEFDNKQPDIVYASYLDYYYKGFGNDQCLAFLTSKKRSILEMELEYILSKQN